MNVCIRKSFDDGAFLPLGYRQIEAPNTAASDNGGSNESWLFFLLAASTTAQRDERAEQQE